MNLLKYSNTILTISCLAPLSGMALINKSLPSKPNIVLVMTGGEPLLQENISKFMEYQQKMYFKAVQVESNGIPDTVVPAGVTLVCSPKC